MSEWRARRHSILVAIATAGLVLVSACGSSGSHSAAAPEESATKPAPDTTAVGSGCGTLSPGGSTTLAMTIDDHRRPG